MKDEKLEKLLNELSDVPAEAVRGGLAEDIKSRIPHRLMAHKGGMGTINIMVDLRISKLAAAAAIIITMVLFAHFFSSRDVPSGGIYQDSKLLVEYLFGVKRSPRYGYLAQQDEGVYYGGDINTADSNELLMHWKLDDGNYRVMFGNLRTKTVSAEELIELQAQMLQKKIKLLFR